MYMFLKENLYEVTSSHTLHKITLTLAHTAQTSNLSHCLQVYRVPWQLCTETSNCTLQSLQNRSLSASWGDALDWRGMSEDFSHFLCFEFRHELMGILVDRTDLGMNMGACGLSEEGSLASWCAWFRSFEAQLGVVRTVPTAVAMLTAAAAESGLEVDTLRSRETRCDGEWAVAIGTWEIIFLHWGQRICSETIPSLFM